MRRKRILLRVMLVVCIIAVIVSAAGLGWELYTNWQSQSYYAGLAADIQTQPRVPSPPEGTRKPPAAPEPQRDPEPVDADESTDTEVDFVFVPYLDFEELNLRFPGVVAWIKLEDTAIDYPVMHGTDNDYYLTRLPDGTVHRSGSIFLDYRNNYDFSDKSLSIYGHESRTMDMFGYLKNYRKQEFLDANPVIYLYTPRVDYEIVVIAAYLVDSAAEIPPMQFSDDNEFFEHIANIKSRSFVRSDFEVLADDRIVHLCTCAYDFDNARLIVVGILVEF
jgi:sortase B